MIPSGLGGGIFPLPACESPRACSSTSRRLQQRVSKTAQTVSVANASLFALHSYFSPFSPTSLCSQTRTLSSSSFPASSLPPASARALVHVLSCSRRHVCRLAPSLDASCDDTLPYSRDSQELFSAVYPFSSSSVPLSSDSVSFPSSPGTCPLLSVLPPALARRYATPAPALFTPLEDQLKAPSVFVYLFTFGHQALCKLDPPCGGPVRRSF